MRDAGASWWLTLGATFALHSSLPRCEAPLGSGLARALPEIETTAKTTMKDVEILYTKGTNPFRDISNGVSLG